MLNKQKKILGAFGIGVNKNPVWEKVRVSNKDSVRKAGIPNKFSELRITSGSTGKPLYVFYSKKAVESFVRRAATSLRMSGISKNDIVLNLFAYGNYVPGSMYERACWKEGIPIMPLGAPNTYSKEKVLESIAEIKPTVWFSVPSYAITLLDLMKEKRMTDRFPKKVIVAGEKLLESVIKKFNRYGIKVINHFGLTECPAIGVSSRADPNTIQVINDGIFTESVTVDGTQQFVVTDLHNTATPIIRYLTGDSISGIKKNPDGTLAEFSIVGRVDNLVKIQGVLVPRTKIIETISKFTDSFFVNIKTKGGRDFVDVFLNKKCKRKEKIINAQLDFLKKRKLYFRKRVLVPVTISYKNNYINDSRK